MAIRVEKDASVGRRDAAEGVFVADVGLAQSARSQSADPFVGTYDNAFKTHPLHLHRGENRGGRAAVHDDVIFAPVPGVSHQRQTQSDHRDLLFHDLTFLFKFVAFTVP